MSEKDYLVYLLTELSTDWSTAKVLLTLLSRGQFENTIIQKLSEFFLEKIQKTTDLTQKRKFQNELLHLKKLRKIENSDRLDEKEIDNLLSLL